MRKKNGLAAFSFPPFPRFSQKKSPKSPETPAAWLSAEPHKSLAEAVKKLTGFRWVPAKPLPDGTAGADGFLNAL